ncbi:MAG: spermidine/putrescine ABC transporter substrate-binding protein [Scytolyngbya sp. HA4215-MV1]|nr:spermidine/putrescine ABC transporter substrate-binding protein [Scytolyngbya sp. HA4215-MV1]
MRSSGATRRNLLITAAFAALGYGLSKIRWRLGGNPNSHPSTPKTLEIYTWSSYVDQKLLDDFKAQTGITEVVVGILGSNEEMLAAIKAGKGGTYSILYPSDYAVTQLVQANKLQPLDHSRLIGLENILPKFRHSVHDPGNRYSIPVSWGTTGLIYNSEKLTPPPRDWSYLWQYPKLLSRRFTLLDDMREVMGATLKSMGYSYNSQNPEEIKQAYEKLVELKPHIASFTTDAWKDQLLAGDLYLAMSYSADAVTLMQEDSRLRYLIPESGTSLWSDTIVIPQPCPNETGAYAWLNFILQPSVAADMTQRLFFATPNQAAYDQLPAPLRNNQSLFPPDALLTKSEGIAPLNEAMTEIYDRYWTKLTSS